LLKYAGEASQLLGVLFMICSVGLDRYRSALLITAGILIIAGCMINRRKFRKKPGQK